MKTNVIYPYGPLADLLTSNGYREHRVYGIEFQPSSIVKVGRSKNVAERFRALAREAAESGLTPVRFVISPVWSNAGRVEQGILATLRDETDPFVVGSEWFQGVTLDRVAELFAEWVVYTDDNGNPVGLRATDLAAKEEAEADAAAEVPA